jgi:rSAM/selenodomain-associated transferase 1
MSRHLVIFARLPRLGTGKRRLAAEIGALAALRFQRGTLGAVIRSLGSDPRWKTWLAVTPARGGPWPYRLPLIRQVEGDLGQRMFNVFATLPPGPAMIIGSDIPAIRPSHIAAGFKALGDHDAVFGPAADGGYWLIGLRWRPRLLDPFDDVRWSTRHALADTQRNLPRCRLAFLPMLEDIDDAAALRRSNERVRAL